MKKLGLCLAFSGQNYGMLLQAYATQQLLEKQGYKTEIINYVAEKKRGVRFNLGLIVYGWKMFIRRIKRTQKKVPLDKIHRCNIMERIKVSNRFRDENLHNLVTYHGIDSLKKAGAENYDAVIVGSDQQWLPDIAFTNFKTLRFVPDHVLKISYSASFGVSELPWYTRSAARQFLNRIDHIAVRESSGKRIVETISDKTATLVLDPTYLLTADQWESLLPAERTIESPYILCYFLGNNEESKKAARAYADKNGVKLVTILSDESFSPIDVSFADVVITGKGPETFLDLIRHAECVMTDSFHGIAFSIIHSKQFFAFYRNKTTDKNSRNTRIDNILEIFDIQHRLIRNPLSLAKQEPDTIEYVHVNEKLDMWRQKSFDYLQMALSSLHKT